MEKFLELERAIQSAKEDADKFYTKGNGAAGTRLRKHMQDIAKLTKDIRVNVQETKNAAK